jgi:hypothetical protein
MSANSKVIAGVAELAKTSERHTLTSEQAAAALNEHGFLLQQAVRKRIEGYTENSVDFAIRWQLEAYEYPVQAPDKSETIIDILLKSGSTYLCLECKRPNADYKHWLFFESSSVHGISASYIFFEASTRNFDNIGVRRHLDRLPPHKIATFKHFLEVSLTQPAKEGKVNKNKEQAGKEKLARTDGLHAALRQAITGTSGLASKLVATGATGRAVPVIVTTAQLYEARYPVDSIEGETGTVVHSNLSLNQHPFVAVQYSAPEALGLTALSQHERAVGINDLINSILRTVYIVRVHKMNDFLHWAGNNLARQ